MELYTEVASALTVHIQYRVLIKNYLLEMQKKKEENTAN